MDLLLEFLKSIFSFDENNQLLFTQLQFWIFFLVVFAGFSLVHSKILLRNTFLFFVSVFFYYKTSGWFTLILVFATFFNYLDGFLIHHSKGVGKKIWLIFGLVVNLATLCYLSTPISSRIWCRICSAWRLR